MESFPKNARRKLHGHSEHLHIIQCLKEFCSKNLTELSSSERVYWPLKTGPREAQYLNYSRTICSTVILVAILCQTPQSKDWINQTSTSKNQSTSSTGGSIVFECRLGKWS